MAGADMERFRLSQGFLKTAPGPAVVHLVIHLVVRPVVHLLIPVVRRLVDCPSLSEPRSPVLAVSRRIRLLLDSAESVAFPSARSRSSGGNRGRLR